MVYFQDGKFTERFRLDNFLSVLTCTADVIRQFLVVCFTAHRSSKLYTVEKLIQPVTLQFFKESCYSYLELNCFQQTILFLKLNKHIK